MQKVFDRAVARHNAGDAAGARKLYRRILKAEPRNPLVLNLSGVADFQLGRKKAAIESLTKAIAIAPDYGDAHYNYANVLAQLGRGEEAVESYRAAVRLEPGNGKAHYSLGALLRDLGRWEEALAAYRHLLALGTGGAEIHNDIGLLLSELERWDEAAASFRQAIAIDPNYAKAHYHLGNVERAQEHLQAAADCYGRAVAADPDYLLAYNNLGLTQHELGRMAEAEASFRRAVAIDRNYAPAWVNLGILNSGGGGDDIAEFERLIAQPDLPATDAIGLHFSLGQAYERQGAQSEAFDHIVTGNRLKHDALNYDAAAMADNFSRIQAVFDTAFFERRAAVGDGSNLPVFILGMPRSGTTLIEQILASHGDVHGAGELPEMGAIAKQLPQRLGTDQGYPDCVPVGADELWAELGAEYVDAVSRLAPDKARVCDKMPANFLRLGLIHLMLPNAAIIHCRRDAMDTCYSCFSLLFSDGQHFAYDLAELGQYYRQYDALMQHWHQVLPGRILDVHYEDVVNDLEASARRLVAHCGLQWDDRCLDFHKTERAVRTASKSQVRQPIYASSLGRWRRHQDHLGPLIEALGPLVKI